MPSEAPTIEEGARFFVDRAAQRPSRLTEDAQHGLTSTPKSIPSKYFYDAQGSTLFDRLCDTPEYYPMRTEQRLLDEIAQGLLAEVRPEELVELGSGAARKTCSLLDAAQRCDVRLRFVPFDVSESMLRASAKVLLARYPWLSVRAVVGDFERDLALLPRGPRRLVAFLGGTIGNLTELEAVRFLRRLRARLGPQDRLLLGTDLVKDRRVLHAAYNDAQGVTAAFNRNLLQVLNRDLGANFDAARFEHVAFFEPRKRRIEMHLRATSAHRVEVPRAGLCVSFRKGETLHTEISRKFTRRCVTRLLRAAGWTLLQFYTPKNAWYALSLARPQR